MLELWLLKSKQGPGESLFCRIYFLSKMYFLAKLNQLMTAYYKIRNIGTQDRRNSGTLMKQQNTDETTEYRRSNQNIAE